MSIDLVKGTQIKLKKTYSSNTIITDNNDAIALFFISIISTKHEFEWHWQTYVKMFYFLNGDFN